MPVHDDNPDASLSADAELVEAPEHALKLHDALCSFAESRDRERAMGRIDALVEVVDEETMWFLATRWDPRRSREAMPVFSLLWWREVVRVNGLGPTPRGLPRACDAVRRAWSFRDALRIAEATLQRVPSLIGRGASLRLLAGHVREVAMSVSIPAVATRILVTHEDALASRFVAYRVVPFLARKTVDRIARSRRRTYREPDPRTLDDVLGLLHALPPTEPSTRRLWLQVFAEIPHLRDRLARLDPKDEVLAECLTTSARRLRAFGERPVSVLEIDQAEFELHRHWMVRALLGRASYLPSAPIAPTRLVEDARVHERYWRGYSHGLRYLSDSELEHLWPTLVPEILAHPMLDPFDENAYWIKLREHAARISGRTVRPAWFAEAWRAFIARASDDGVRDQRVASLFAAVAPFVDVSEIDSALDAWCRTFDRLPTDTVRRYLVEKLRLLSDSRVPLANAQVRDRIAWCLERDERHTRSQALEIASGEDARVLEALTPILHVARDGGVWGNPVMRAALRETARDLRQGRWAAEQIGARFVEAYLAANPSGGALVPLRALAGLDADIMHEIAVAIVRDPRQDPSDRVAVLREWASLGPPDAVRAHATGLAEALLGVRSLGVAARPLVEMAATAASRGAELRELWPSLAAWIARRPARERARLGDLATLSPRLLRELGPLVTARAFPLRSFGGFRLAASVCWHRESPDDVLSALQGAFEAADAPVREQLWQILSETVPASRFRSEAIDTLDFGANGADVEATYLRLGSDDEAPCEPSYRSGAFAEAWRSAAAAGRTYAREAVRRALHDIANSYGRDALVTREQLLDWLEVYDVSEEERIESPFEWVRALIGRVRSEIGDERVTVRMGIRELREDRFGRRPKVRTGDVLIIVRNLASNAVKHGGGHATLVGSATSIEVHSRIARDDFDRFDAAEFASAMAGQATLRGRKGLGVQLIREALARGRGGLRLVGDIDTSTSPAMLVMRLVWDQPDRPSA